jgi:hypothetical protein
MLCAMDLSLSVEHEEFRSASVSEEFFTLAKSRRSRNRPLIEDEAVRQRLPREGVPSPPFKNDTGRFSVPGGSGLSFSAQ